MMPISSERCLICKGSRLLCGQKTCPLLNRIRIQEPIREKLSENIFGPSPSIFVGWKNYPNVFIGPMTAIEPEKVEILDNPAKWYGMNFDEIIGMRSALVRSKSAHNVRDKTRFIEKSQEIALSIKPTEIEAEFKSRPKYKISFSSITQPMGPSGIIKDFRITENPRIPGKVDSVISDELKATDALYQLYQSDFDVYYLINLLSSGILGLQENRKLVPTRWSITSVHSIIANKLIEEIKRYPSINEYRIYSNEYLGNHYEILLMPGRWEFENFEAWAPKTPWTLTYERPVILEEYEGYRGRSGYAFRQAGGYYASRLGVVEGLNKIRRQARVVAFREINEDYLIPVGVWQCLENVRNAVRNPHIKFNTAEEALNHINNKLGLSIKEYVQRSVTLKQKRLVDF